MDAVLGWVVREATTNVLRHSGARSVTVGLSATATASRSPSPTTAGGGDGPPGRGLAGLAERVEALGGRLEAGPVDGRGFRLAAVVPVARAGRGSGDQPVIRVLIAEDQTLVRGALAGAAGAGGGPRGRRRGRPGRRRRRGRAASTGRTWRCSTSRCPAATASRPPAALAAALPGCRAVILTTFGRPGFLRRAMEVGAAGFLVKDAPVAELARGIRAVMAGERVIDRELAAAALAIGATPLSAREADVLRAAADGATVADIAGRLFLSEGTVRNYLSSAIGKTGARTRVEAARVAAEKGWL